MGRQGFRVLLMRVTPERTLFRALTIAFWCCWSSEPPPSYGMRGAGVRGSACAPGATADSGAEPRLPGVSRGDG